MKALCTKSDLLDGVNKVQKAVSTRNTLPVLQGIKINADGEALVFEATDLEMGIRCRVPVNVLEKGKLVLPSDLMTDLTRRLPDGAIMLEGAEGALNISYGESSFKVLGYDADEYPEFGVMDMEEKFTIEGAQLKHMIRQTIFARAAVDDAKNVFSGVFIEKAGESIRMVCTDTHRLTYNFLPLTEEGSDFQGVIPGRTMAEILRILDDGPVSVSFDKTKIIFKFQNVDVMTRLISGQYPLYENVIPQTCLTKLKMNTRQFAEVVERASLLSRDNSLKIPFVRFMVEDNSLTIDQNNEKGRIFEMLEVEQEGEDVQLSFNGRYLLDMIKVMDTEYLTMEVNGSQGAVIFRPEGITNYISLILPMRL
jgi:DNA polymerase-3 subunit beta